MKHRTLISLSFLAGGLLCFALPVLAEDKVSSPVHFEKTFSKTDPINFQTAWIGVDPDKHPNVPGIAVRFEIYSSGAVVSTKLSGEGVLAPSPDGTDFGLTWEAAEDDGVLGLDMGFEIAGELSYNFGFNLKGIVDLPIPPMFDILRIQESASFTPFLLDGSGDAPVAISKVFPETMLFTIDILDVIPLPIAGLSGGVSLSLAGGVEASLAGRKLVCTPQGDLDPIVHEQEGTSKLWRDHGAGVESGMASYVADVGVDMDLELTPEIYVQLPLLGGAQFDKNQIPVPLGKQAIVGIFEEQPLTFDVALLESPEDDSNHGGESGGGGGKEEDIRHIGSEGCAVAAVSHAPWASLWSLLLTVLKAV